MYKRYTVDEKEYTKEVGTTHFHAIKGSVSMPIKAYRAHNQSANKSRRKGNGTTVTVIIHIKHPYAEKKGSK